MTSFRSILTLAAFAVAALGPWSAASATTPNDIARFVAGLPVAADSSAVAFTKRPAWHQHARSLDQAWGQLDQVRLTKIRAWSEKNLANRRHPLFYMFSGPDFVYANAFFPGASTYLMSGLEPVGRIPEINDRSLAALSRLRSALRTSMSISFFITQEMQSDLRGNELGGALPVLLAYIARSGKTVQDIKLVEINKEGAIADAGAYGKAKTADGVRIVLASGEGAALQTVLYFRTDLSNSGVENSGFLKLAAGLGNGDSMLKSASYLMHSKNFTKVRDFVLTQSDYVVQDDSGIPAFAFAKDDWQLNPFGRYNGPIPIFRGHYQRQLSELYKTAKPPALDFGIGYRWRNNDSNLVLAVRKTPKIQAQAQ